MRNTKWFFPTFITTIKGLVYSALALILFALALIFSKIDLNFITIIVGILTILSVGLCTESFLKTKKIFDDINSEIKQGAFTVAEDQNIKLRVGPRERLFSIFYGDFDYLGVGEEDAYVISTTKKTKSITIYKIKFDLRILRDIYICDEFLGNVHHTTVFIQ